MAPTQLPIVWAALLVSQLVYLLVPAAQADGARVPALFVYALGLVALAEATGIVVLLRVALFGPLRSGAIDPATQAGAQRTFTVFLIAWTLAESIAIYGLVLRFLSFDRAHSLPFAVAAALLFLYARPWGAHLRKAQTSADLARSGAPIR